MLLAAALKLRLCAGLAPARNPQFRLRRSIPNFRPGDADIGDPAEQRHGSYTQTRTPKDLKPGVDYGISPKTGELPWSGHARSAQRPEVPWRLLNHWGQDHLHQNVKVLAFYENVVASPFHVWNNIIDFDGKRYLYLHDRDYLRIMDVTDPANAMSCSPRARLGPQGSGASAGMPRR